MPMLQNVYQRIEWMKYKISSLWDNSVSIFCVSIIIILLSFGNASIAFLLPLSIGIDLLMLTCATFANYKQTFRAMREDIHLFSDIKELDDNFKEKCLSETRIYKMYREGDRYGTKNISVYISGHLNEASKAYSFFNDESIVLLHKNFDSEEYNDRFTLLHEMGHCVWHSLLEQKRTATLLQTSLYALASIIFSIMSHVWWAVSIGIILWLVMIFVESKKALRSRLEMGADAMALITYEHLYGKEQTRKMAKIVASRYYMEILAKPLSDSFDLLNGLWSISRFMSDSDKHRFVTKIDEQLITEEEWKSQDNRTSIQKIKSAKKIVESAPMTESFRDSILTWNPVLYYFVFPLLMLVTWFTASKVLFFITIPWWTIFLCIIPIILTVFIRRLAVKEVIGKYEFIQYVINSLK